MPVFLLNYMFCELSLGQVSLIVFWTITYLILNAQRYIYHS